MKLSIIMPVFNEIRYIKEFTNNIKNTFINEDVEYRDRIKAVCEKVES